LDPASAPAPQTAPPASPGSPKATPGSLRHAVAPPARTAANMEVAPVDSRLHRTSRGSILNTFATDPQTPYDRASMRWVLKGNLTPAVTHALVRHEQKPVTESELQLASDATPFDFLKTAQSKQLDVFTNDANLVNAIFESKIYFNRVVVYLQLEGGDVEQDDAVDRLFERYKRLTPGRLYTVTGSRVKVRQLPGGI
jgi:hypothetical protein